MRRVLISLFSIGVIAIVAVFATQAFFNDTETSVGNVLQAGALDLKIDNTCYYNGDACILDTSSGLSFWDGVPDNSQTPAQSTNICSCTWGPKDLAAGDLFFNLRDLKPGDWEEDTISIDVDNPSWLCADINVQSHVDNTCTEPENAAVGGESGACIAPNGPGDLAQELYFVFWEDDGDNVWECEFDGERPTENCEKVLTEGTADNVLGDVQWAIADSSTNTGPIGTDTEYIGKYFCFGRILSNPVAQGATPADPTVASGFDCDGTGVDNKSQTDLLTGDISFYAEQFRHNEEFLCNPPQRVESGAMQFGPNGWGGWSCPAGTHVVGGGYEPFPAAFPVAISEAAKLPSLSGLYPVYPHYTYTPPETGWVVQNGGTGQSLNVYALCAAD